jgi:glycosyltransferase involved in cell wall biosynthesis
MVFENAHVNHEEPMSAIPPITIGFPVYNREKFIRTSLDSLLAQTFTDFEVVICDNASTDNTAAICREYAARDTRISFYRNDVNIGANRNFNRVFQLSRGKYLKWSTSDDYWAPQTLERLFPIMEKDASIALCYPKTTICNADGTPREAYEDDLHLMEDSPADRFISLLARLRLCHQHLGLIRRSCLASTALLGDHIACDINLLAELSLYGKFYEHPERMFFRRFHPESSSAKKGPDRDAVEHQLDFTDPQRLLGVRHHLLQRHQAFFSAVRRAPLTAKDRRRLYTYLLRGVVWDRQALAAEILADFRGVLRRAPRPQPLQAPAVAPSESPLGRVGVVAPSESPIPTVNAVQAPAGHRVREHQ